MWPTTGSGRHLRKSTAHSAEPLPDPLQEGGAFRSQDLRTEPVDGGGATYADAVAQDAPIAWYRMGEPSGTNAADEIGSNDGTYGNTPTLGVAGALTGDSDTAITFNGTDEQITVPDHASLDLGDVVTVEAWVNSAVGGGDKGIVGKDTGAYYLRLDTDNRLSFLKANIA